MHHELVAWHAVLFPSGRMEEIDELCLAANNDVVHRLRPYHGIGAEEHNRTVYDLELYLSVGSLKFVDFTDRQAGKGCYLQAVLSTTGV